MSGHSSEQNPPFIQASQQTQIAAFFFFFTIAVAVFSSAYLDMVFIDGDSPWHLATGDYIRIHGIPASDPWSFSAGNYPWINLSWLYNIIISWVAQHFGLELLMVMVIAITAAAAAIITVIQLRLGCGFIAVALACVLMIICFKPSLNIRPQTATIVFSALCFLQLELYHNKPDWKRLLPLPIYTLLWVNMHGGFLTLYILLGAYGLEALLHRHSRQFGALFLCGIVCMAAAFANPYGLNIIEGTLRTFHSPLSTNYIAEWMPATLANSPTTYVYLVLLILLPKRALYQRPALLVLAVFWMIEALLAFRYIGMAALFTTPAIALGIHEALAKNGAGTRYLAKTTEYTHDLAKPGSIKALGLISVSFLLILALPQTRQHVWTETVLNPAKYPVAEIDYAKAHYPNAHIFNNYGYGGLMIYLSNGTLKPMIDGRANTAYPQSVVDDYLKLENFEDGWKNVLEKYTISVALVSKKDAKLTYHLTEYAGWKIAFRGEKADVLVKR